MRNSAFHGSPAMKESAGSDSRPVSVGIPSRLARTLSAHGRYCSGASTGRAGLSPEAAMVKRLSLAGPRDPKCALAEDCFPIYYDGASAEFR